eukprot:1478934-Alexandrium_andersonii.AAC.1
MRIDSSSSQHPACVKPALRHCRFTIAPARRSRALQCERHAGDVRMHAQRRNAAGGHSDLCCAGVRRGMPPERGARPPPMVPQTVRN